MTSIFGKYETKLDGKGRLILPARLRAKLSPDQGVFTIFIRKGFERCLEVWPETIYQKTFAKVLDSNPFDPEEIDKVREVIGDVEELEVDAGGRFVIPKRFFTDDVQLNKDITLFGVGNRFEIWDSALLEEKRNNITSESIKEWAKDFFKTKNGNG